MSYKSLALAMLVAISADLAQARSLHPCTPTVQARPTLINCNNDDKNYNIIVNISMSPPDLACTGEDYYTYKTATVEVSQKNGDKFLSVAKLEVYHGNFSYTLDPTGDATFTSNALGLTLKDCATPLHGGFSVGNSPQQ